MWRHRASHGIHGMRLKSCEGFNELSAVWVAFKQFGPPYEREVLQGKRWRHGSAEQGPSAARRETRTLNNEGWNDGLWDFARPKI